MRWTFASGRGEDEVLGRNLSPLTCVSKVCFYAIMIITIFNDVVCPPFVQWTVKPFLFPQYFFSLFFFFVLFPPLFFLSFSFFLINTNDIQLNSRRIAVGSQLPGRAWPGVLGQSSYALNQGRWWHQPRRNSTSTVESLDWTVQEAVSVFKLGSKHEGEEPGGRSFKT